MPYCSSCGQALDPSASYCPSCGTRTGAGTGAGPLGGAGSPYPPPPRAPIPTYLPQAILTTLFCCLPLGIVSIVYAASVSGKQAAGDVEGALEASRKARSWAWAAFGVGLAGIALWMLFAVSSGAVSDGGLQ
jgi:hypothetical protein